MDEPTDLAAGICIAAAETTCTGRNRLGAMGRSRTVGRLQSADRTVRMAWMVELRYRRARRHGLPHHGHGLLGDEPRSSRRSVQAVQNGATELSPPINSIITWDFAKKQLFSERTVSNSIGTTDTSTRTLIVTVGR